MSTLPELSFDWTQACGELPEDSMGRAEHARNLTQFLIQKGQETSYVLNLNAKWGTGKTYFLRRWVEEIKHIYPTVYIDAWSSDHSDDPLLTVVSEINNTLHALLDISTFETALFQGVAKTAKVAVPSVIKALLKGQLKKWTGLNSEDLEGIISADDLADSGAELVKEAINAHNEASVGVENIKKSITEWLISVINQNKRNYPLFVFIDELDRCRPTYAIEMLETIKHIFDMKNVVFVVATDKDQLQHSIRAVYGAEFNSRLYLDRFFTRTIALTNPSRTDFISQKFNESDTFIDFVKNADNFVYMDSEKGYKADLIELLSRIADGFDWPLRTVNLWLDRLEAAIIISSRKFDIIVLSFMMALETDDSDWLNKYQNGIPIFRDLNSGITEKVKFKSFLINTRWSFSKYKEDLINRGYEDQPALMNSQRNPQIDLVAFVKNRLDLLESISDNNLRDIGEQYQKAIFGQGVDTMRIDYTGSGPVYESAALYFHNYFHEKNSIKLKHYYEMCRYSSLMS